jgi:hypothetical protein
MQESIWQINQMQNKIRYCQIAKILDYYLDK